jgi:hypothetical protein
MLSATVVAEFIDAGLVGDALVQACRRVESPTYGEGGDASPEEQRRFPPRRDRSSSKTLSVLVAKARKAFGLMPGLTASDIRVASALLAHVNTSTGACYPSQDRLARLLRIEVRQVRRAIRKCEGRGFLLVMRHGGSNGTSRYVFVYSALSNFVDRWEAEAFGDAEGLKRTIASGAPDKPVRQTQENSLKNAIRRNSQEKQLDSLRREPPLLLPLGGGLANRSSKDVAEAKADSGLSRRLDAYLGKDRHHPDIIETLAPVWTQAVALEINRPDAGFERLRDAVKALRAKTGQIPERSG